MIRLTVTLDHLKRGVINSRTGDPIALAAMKAGLIAPQINRRSIMWTDQVAEKAMIAPLPIEAIAFLHRLRYEDRFEMLEMASPSKDQIAKAKTEIALIKAKMILFPNLYLSRNMARIEELSHIANGERREKPFSFMIPDGIKMEV